MIKSIKQNKTNHFYPPDTPFIITKKGKGGDGGVDPFSIVISQYCGKGLFIYYAKLIWPLLDPPLSRTLS